MKKLLFLLVVVVALSVCTKTAPAPDMDATEDANQIEDAAVGEDHVAMDAVFIVSDGTQAD